MGAKNMISLARMNMLKSTTVGHDRYEHNDCKVVGEISDPLSRNDEFNYRRLIFYFIIVVILYFLNCCIFNFKFNKKFKILLFIYKYTILKMNLKKIKRYNKLKK